MTDEFNNTLNILRDNIRHIIDNLKLDYKERMLISLSGYDYNFLAFLLYAKFFNYINFNNIDTLDDILIELGNSNIPNREKAIDLWKSLKIFPEAMPEIIRLIASCPLEHFSNEADALDFWIDDNLFDQGYGREEGDGYATQKAFEVIKRFQDKVGLDFSSGNILYSIDDIEINKRLLSHYTANDSHITIFSEKISAEVKIKCALNPKYKNVSLVEGVHDCVFSLNNVKFDIVVYQRDYKDYEKDTLNERESLDSVFNFVKDSGSAVYFNQSIKIPDDSFFTHHILMALYLELFLNDEAKKICVVCKNKTKDNNYRFPYLYITPEDPRVFLESEIKSYEKSLDSNQKGDYVQFLTPDDFKYSKTDIHYNSVMREFGQENWIWVDLSKIFRSVNYHYNQKAILDSNDIIDSNSLSDNPFHVNNIPETSYLKDLSKDNLYETYGPTIERYRYDYYSMSGISEDFHRVLADTYFFNKKESQNIIFDRLLTTRILTQNAILLHTDNYNCTSKVSRVKASTTHPLAFRLFKVQFSGDPIDFDCKPEIDPVLVNQTEYDENFIIYQIIESGVRKNHLLVAPTKKEQHTFFISKRREYIYKLQSAVDEIEDDITGRFIDISSRINGLGFKNFRKFSDLSTVPLGGVNILVGANNAGKSTFVKGLLLAFDNLKHLRIEQANSIFDIGNAPVFKLDSDTYSDVHVGTFERALNNLSKSADSDNCKIEFTISIAFFEITFAISQDNLKKSSSNVPITSIIINDNKRGLSFGIDYVKKNLSVFSNGDNEETFYCNDISLLIDSVGKLLLPQILRGLAMNLESSRDTQRPAFVDKLMGVGEIYDIADELESVIINSVVEYIYAHGISQRPVFDYYLRNDYMALTLHDLINEGISKAEQDFIRTWLVRFGIGSDYDVQSILGESYILRLKTNDKKWTNLADVGMGTNQLITLLFRLAIFIHRQSILGENPYKPTIIIEEPEQNMHPAFQSKLADLFFEMNQKYGFSFVVETHSEYLVRRTQVIVKEQHYAGPEDLNANNPIKVYYFPAKKNPYQMKFRTDGNFSNKFGSGFFDEASNLLFQIL